MLDIYVLFRIFDFIFSTTLFFICLAYERQNRHLALDFPIHTRTKELFFNINFQKDTIKFSLALCAVLRSIYISSYIQKNPFFSFLQNPAALY